MSFKSQLNNKYWNESKQIFFTPKLSLEGRNLFPHISELHSFQPSRQQPFLNILKKPIMSLYDRSIVRSQKKPVCIVGMTKQVETRFIKTGHNKKNRPEISETNIRKETLLTFTPELSKTEIQILTTPSKQIIPISQPPAEGHHYVIGPGNNRELVEEVLRNRQAWYPTGSSIFHLRWQQARPKFQNTTAPHRQAINHLPGHQVISDKANLLTNLKVYCQKNEEMMYKIVPVSFILDFASEDVQEELKKFITFFVQCSNKCELDPEKEDEEDMKVSKMLIKKKQTSGSLQSPKKSNQKACKLSPSKTSKFKSEIFYNPQNKKREESKNLYKSLVSFLKPYYVCQDMSIPKRQSPWVTAQADDIYGETSLWLLKPSDLNRGRGIKLFRTVEQVGQILKSELQKHESGSFIVQKYIERPLLISCRKFDIRVWTLVTHTRQLYFFRQGYIRLSSDKYTLQSSSLLTHLTNNAVQKHGTNYGEFEQGNILPLSYLYEQGFVQKHELYSQIKRKIVVSMKAAGNKLYQPTEKNQSISVSTMPGIKQNQSKVKYFEFFGYDFMVDERKNFWLIEVNTNPCLEKSNNWLATIIPRMLDDGFKLTIDKLFPNKKATPKERTTYPVNGYDDDFNMWEYLEINSGELSSTIQ